MMYFCGDFKMNKLINPEGNSHARECSKIQYQQHKTQ